VIAVVGLGNPGDTYLLTRHNVGFRVLSLLIKKFNCIKCIKKRYYKIFSYTTKFEKVVLVKPLVFINNSGEAVRQLVEEYDINLEELLVICDDFNLPLGKIRIRKKGSDGGHNGLASIIRSLNNQNFPRLRCGIGFCRNTNVSEFVLSPFSKNEKIAVERMIKTASNAVEDFYRKGIDWTMNNYN